MDLQKSNNGGKAKARAMNKFLGVRQRPSGKWVAEIKNTTKKIRMWLGTFNTAEEAARAYDEAACLLRGSNTRTNFAPKHVSSDSPLSVKIRNLLHEKKHLSTSTTTPAAAVCTRPQQSLPLVAPNKACISVGTDSPSISHEDVYSPDLGDFQQGLSPFDQLCTFPLAHHQDFGLPCESQDLEITEFERMRVERQISASLYAINGVNEFLENVNLPDDFLWDFPDSLVPNINHARYLC